MSLPKFAVSIYNKRTNEHIIDTLHTWSEVHAGYIAFENNFDKSFPDNDERETFELEDMQDEFNDYGYSIVVIKLD